MYKINEIFLSLQGEGHQVGRTAVFIRFSGCNLQCPFCDTDFASYTLLSAHDILTKVQALPSELIILTGGEPTIQLDQALIDALRPLNRTICLETNGTIPLKAQVDWICCSPKPNTKLQLTHADEVKVIYQGTDVEYWRQQLTSPNWYLQPCSCQNTSETIDYIHSHSNWRLSIQVHKYLDIK